MNSAARIAWQLAYTAFVAWLITIILKYDFTLSEQTKMTFNPYPSLFFGAMYPIFLGGVFAIPSLFREFRKEGTWTFDWINVLTIGLPALIGAFLYLIYFSPLSKFLTKLFYLILIGGKTLPIISGIVFGYVFLRAFRKSQ